MDFKLFIIGILIVCLIYGTESAPVTTHPRLYITVNDLPALRAWANSSNPIYTQGLEDMMQPAVYAYDHYFFPGGKPNPSWTTYDNAGTMWTQYPAEAYASYFAFMSLIDPNVTARPVHITRAKNLLMFILNNSLNTSSTLYTDPSYSTYDRSRYWGENLGATVDWIYSSLTTQEKSTIRQAFLRWANFQITAAESGNEHPQPEGVLNDPSLLSDPMQLRWAANNYFLGHFKMLVHYATCLDAADDPPLNVNQPVSQLGNTLRSYIYNAVGAWLYQIYAIHEKSSIVAADYGIADDPSVLGVASGGCPVEGLLYGSSAASTHQALYVLYTTGWLDSSLGVQVKFINSSYWDRLLNCIYASLVAAPKDFPGGYNAPMWQSFTYGEELTEYFQIDYAQLFGSLAMYWQKIGRTDKIPLAKWGMKYVIDGGEQKFVERLGAGNWGNGYSIPAIFEYIVFGAGDDTPSSDIRATTYPTTFYDPARTKVLARTNWTAAGSIFTFNVGWNTITHASGDAAQIEFMRNNEFLFRERSGYGELLALSESHNTLNILNDQMTDPQWLEVDPNTHGAQFIVGTNAGDPSTIVSDGSEFFHGYADFTNAYNSPSQWTPGNNVMDVVAAHRLVFWMKNYDLIVVYDRAETTKTGRFKKWNLCIPYTATISGSLITQVTPGGQRLFVTAVLPASNQNITVAPVEDISQYPGITLAELDPINYRITIEDTTKPVAARFLTVLEGSDSTTPTPATYIQSDSSGSNILFEGVLVGGNLNRVFLFPQTRDKNFVLTQLVYSNPSANSTHYIAGLQPNTPYSVSISQGIVTVTPFSSGQSTTTDSAGVLIVGQAGNPGPSPVGTPSPSPNGGPQPSGAASVSPSGSSPSSSPGADNTSSSGGGGKGSSGKTALIAVVVVLGVAFLATVGLLGFLFLRKRRTAM